MSPYRKGDNSTNAAPDRQKLPVKTGNDYRSGAADFAGHSL
jgi:hypothetical protein